MANYKVLQDIEAEDKLLGPLTLRQFIYAGICVLCLYLGFLAITKGVAFILIVLLPVAALSAFFAFPWKLNQPTETWALAVVRFFLKPRKRIWDQSGAKELVTITAPKMTNLNSVKDISQGEVKSRLKSLADVLDSRGWAIKNGNTSSLGRSDASYGNQVSDRLLIIEPVVQAVPDVEILASDDIMDDTSNPTAQRFKKMIDSASTTRFNGIKENLNGQQSDVVPSHAPIISQGTHSSNSTGSSEHKMWFLDNKMSATIPPRINDTRTTAAIKPQTLESAAMSRPAARNKTSPTPMTQTSNTDILNLARNNDLNIATIARQVNKKQSGDMLDEVVISLH